MAGRDPYQTLCHSAYCALRTAQAYTHIHTHINMALHGLHDNAGGEGQQQGGRMALWI